MISLAEEKEIIIQDIELFYNALAVNKPEQEVLHGDLR